MDKQKQSRAFVWVEVEGKCRFVHALPEKSAEVLVSHEECKVSLQLIISVNKQAPNAEKKNPQIALTVVLNATIYTGIFDGIRNDQPLQRWFGHRERDMSDK